MAEAEKIPADYQVRLTLTRDEAETLKDVMGNICGSHVHSRRKYTTNIFDALSKAGVDLPENGGLDPFKVINYDSFK